MARRGTAQCGMEWRGTARYGKARRNMLLAAAAWLTAALTAVKSRPDGDALYASSPVTPRRITPHPASGLHTEFRSATPPRDPAAAGPPAFGRPRCAEHGHTPVPPSSFRLVGATT